jgi:histidyl-tRNA synthetase
MAERPDFRAPKGTHDVLPPESARWEALLAVFARIAGRHGYGLIQSPMFEDVGVFQRIGEGTDVVAKEMYDFEDKGGRRMADPDVDVEVIALGHAFLTALGLREWRLVVNSMGTPADRAAYASVLQAWLRGRG